MTAADAIDYAIAALVAAFALLIIAVAVVVTYGAIFGRRGGDD